VKRLTEKLRSYEYLEKSSEQKVADNQSNQRLLDMMKSRADDLETDNATLKNSLQIERNNAMGMTKELDALRFKVVNYDILHLPFSVH
jgi:hypothetical protein